MTSQSSGGSGSGLPGVTTDGQTPGGETIAGALQAGDPNAAGVPSFINLFGNTQLFDAPGNQVDGDDTVDIYQSSPLNRDNVTAALLIVRRGLLNGHAYTNAALQVNDNVGSSAPLMDCRNLSGTQFQVDADGIQVHGKFKTGASVTHTAAVLSGTCVPIYDEAGTLLGYMPLYN